MKQIRLLQFLKILMKSTLLVSMLFFLLMVIQSSNTSGDGSSNSESEILGANLLPAPDEKVIPIDKRDAEYIEERVTEPDERNGSMEISIQMLEKRKFWQTLVKRYWELVRHTDEDIELTNLTDYFIKNPEFSLWGTNTLNNAEVQSSFMETDRILPQLILALEGHRHPVFEKAQKKLIHLYDSFNWWRYDGDFSKFCPGWSAKCEFVNSANHDIDAAVIARDSYHQSAARVPDKVKRLYFIMESQYASKAKLTRTNDLLSSFWRGSDVVAPYGKWVYYDPEVKQLPTDTNYAEGKTKMVAVFVSNCHSINPRLKFIKELQNHIEVDIFGRCGTNKCPRKDDKACFEMLSKDYFFYLSFENSNCRDYITEKFFENALRNNVIPVVLGGHPNDYYASAPKGSYLHIEDFSSAKDLAEKMRFIASNEAEYNNFFRWKGTGEMINAMYLCRVCVMLHYADVVPQPERTQDFVWDSSNSKLCKKPGLLYWNEK